MQTITKLNQVNSTSYVDLLGLQFGLDRLFGESTVDFLKRLEAAVRLRRNHTYEGAVNEINLELGYIPKPYIHIRTNKVITVSIAGLSVGASVIPIVEFDNDNIWKWRLLSDIIVDLNSVQGATAVLLVDDGPALQLARQTNSLWSIAEPLSSTVNQLKYQLVTIGSELFNKTVPSYTLTPEGNLTFEAEPPSGTAITYNYTVLDYDIVGSPIALIGLSDPEMKSAALSGNVLAYQVREFIQEIMNEDRSYWGK